VLERGKEKNHQLVILSTYKQFPCSNNKKKKTFFTQYAASENLFQGYDGKEHVYAFVHLFMMS
jgi:hypothetical protein